MAIVRKITRDDHTVMPWKNGGGMTRQIATGGGAGDDWGWRVSMATVERDGAYSEFPGVDRTTTVIIGNGSDLFHPDGSTIALNPLQPTLIPSDVALWGILRDDPIVNLNVMTRQGQFTSRVKICGGLSEEAISTEDGQVLLIQPLVGTCALQTGNGDTYNAAEQENLIHEGQGAFTLSLTHGSRAAIIRVTAH